MRLRASLAGVAALAVCGLFPGIAGASTAEVDTFSRLATYVAASGEVNDVTVSQTSTAFVFTDPGATITANTGCTSNGPHQVSCDSTGIEGLFIYTGDLNDQATVDSTVGGLSGQVYYQVGAELSGGPGDDILNGGLYTTNGLDGDDSFFESGTDGNDTMTGGNMDDRFFGAGGNDTMIGGGGRDQFRSSSGNDTMSGGDGSDSFEGGTEKDGADVVNGGQDSDSYSTSDRDNAVNISLDGAANDGEGCPGATCEGDNIGADVESVDTGPGNDVLTGSPATNFLNSGDGNDTVNGGGGGDSVFGGNGDDVLHGGAGPDIIGGFQGSDQVFGDAGDDSFISTDVDDDPDRYSGGKGTDVADYSEANSAVRVKLDNKPNDGVAGEGDNVLSDVEDALGSQFNDVMVGSKRANQFEGNDGNDKLRGKGGADGLIGGRGSDSLFGGKGADFLDGGPGPDRLVSRDRSGDEVDCGSSLDRVKGDGRDRFAGDCDRITR
jgi:Ca2+-binding RTX toxin-like protein